MRPLISPDDLFACFRDDDPPVILDVRWSLVGPPGRDEYARGHLPGAVFVDVDTELAGPPGSAGRHPLPDAGSLEQVLRRAGVTATRPVVVYDADNGSVAARAWWLLRWAGHRKVAVLDGGYRAWQAASFPVTTSEDTPSPGDFRVVPGQLPVLDADQAATLAREGRLLDARATERYRGETEPVDPRAGHIPGAVNAPFVDHTDAEGRWRSSTELAERFAGLGIDEGTPVAAYCGSGVTACSVVLALEHAGVRGSDHPAALYAGSWSHWSADPQRSVATGGAPG